MLELVMKDTPIMKPTKTKEVLVSMGNLVEAVSFTSGETNGIGYSYKYFVDTMYQDVNQDVADGVKIISVDGVVPSSENIRAGIYPFVSKYYFVYDENRVSDQTKNILQFIKSESGKRIIEDLDYVAQD
jgi:phosphate transport system substrate-binding protein